MMAGSVKASSLKGLLVIVLSCLRAESEICNTPGWLENEYSQYLLVNMLDSRRSYADARQYCWSVGGNLAFITSKEQNAFLVTYTLKDSVGYNYWIGLNDQDSDGVFTWINNTQSGFTNWISPPSPSEERCVRMRSTFSAVDQGKWRVSSCSSQRVHSCQRPKDPRCLWHLFEQSHFRIYGEGKNFDAARTDCQNDGWDLAVSRSDELNSFLTAMVISSVSPTQCYWFGLKDVGRNDTFIWIDGNRLSEEESRWATGQAIHPNNDCGCLSSNGDGTWNNTTCSSTQPYICERPRVFHSKWTEVNSVLYYMPSQSANFFEAREYCEQLGGMLAQLKTAEISVSVLNNFGHGFWFGLDDLGGEGDFQWADGTLLNDTGFSNWDTNEPDNVEGYEHCVAETTGGWRDRFCSGNHRFVCEISKAPPLRVQAVTSTPFGSVGTSPNYSCILSPPDNTSEILTTTERLVEQSWTKQGYTLDVPGETSVKSGLITQSLPATDQSVGVYKCSSSSTSSGTSTSVAVTILSKNRHLEPEDGHLTRTVYPGESVVLSVTKKDTYTSGDEQIRWRTFSNLAEGSLSPTADGSLVFTIDSATKKDANVYGTYQEGQLESLQYSLIRVIVSDCLKGRWGVPFCNRLCDNCYNGGICHPQSGTCICPPGFSGRNCLTACGEHRFGWDCEVSCGPGEVLESCAGSRVCLPDPYGCSCLAGYTGINCNQVCPDGKFGVDCLQECHCLDGAPCDVFTGRCEVNCESGWSGKECQVPTICPEGYFGADCTKHCNCLGNSFCERNSGFCTDSEGECEIGYIANSPDFPDSCGTFAGCFDSCTKTCHCAGGSQECDQQTGICFSGACHPRWLGENCQTDRFQITREKTNPDVAIFSCTIAFETTAVIGSDYVKAATTDFSTENWHLPEGNTFTEPVNFTFQLTNITGDPAIYCFIGSPQDDAGFAFIKLPASEYYVLPVLSTKPQEFDIGHDHVDLRWRPWDEDSDIGDGPVVAYNIYVHSANNSLLQVTTTEPCPACSSDMLEYHVVSLNPGTRYTIQISATREGINGEGDKGPPLSVMTVAAPEISTTSPDCRSSSLTSWILFAISMLVNVVLAGLLTWSCLKLRRPSTESPTRHTKTSDDEQRYENPTFEGSKNIPNPYQDLQEPSHEANYEELREAERNDYVNSSEFSNN